MKTDLKNITSENLLEAVKLLTSEVSNLKNQLMQHPKEKRFPIGLNEACKIMGKGKPTVYAMVQKGLIPYYKNGKKLYFYEDELLELINSGKRKAIAELIRQQ